MRVLSLTVMTAAMMFSAGALAEPGNWASTPEGKARWDGCYREVRLNYKTYSLSLGDYRQAIKAARRDHMRECMARATPPAPVYMGKPAVGPHPESILSSWARNP